MKARLPQGYGGGAPNNMQQLQRQAQKMQEQMEALTAQLEETEYTASVGGNAVSVTVTGKMEVRSLEIKPEVVDPEDIDMLSDLVLSAVNEALRKAASDKESKMDQLSGGLGGLGLPGLF